MLATTLLVGLAAVPVAAEVVRVEVLSRTDVLGGRAFGTVGAYEKLVGRIYFSFDPTNPSNADIADIGLAPRNGNGRVEAWAEFMVLQPKDPASRRGVAWLEVSNRGGKASLRYFHGAEAALDPVTAAHYGDGLFFRRGLTMIWVGWQWDVPDQEGLLRLHLPFARMPDGPITGLVRADWTVDRATDVLPLAHRNHRTYPAVDPQDSVHVLTVRDGREAPRTVVPRRTWSFLSLSEGPEIGRLTHVRMDGGFEAGKIYELVYRSRDPRVVGLGLAVLRDVASYAKNSLDSPFPARYVVAFGVSQTGRLLRHFLYQGFNRDERGRRAFDGMLVHTAGAGRGSFNHRFAQPSRDGHPYSAFFYPTDLFPFTSRETMDPVTGASGGLLSATPEALRPRVFFTNTGYEYWGRAAALTHVTPDGTADVAPFPTERVYHLASGQHSVGSFPPSGPAGPGGDWTGNPLDFLTTLRALAVRLVDWVAEDRAPPGSRYPRLGDGTLVPVEGLAFPPVSGVTPPAAAHVAYRADYGARFRDRGIVDWQPPLVGGPFPSLVPQVDGLGNELGGIRGFEIRVPVATYAPWRVRSGMAGGNGALTDFVGTWIPFARTEAERATVGDPRPSLEALYGSEATYRARLTAAVADLQAEGFLLEEDGERVLTRGRGLWTWIQDRPPRDAPARPEPPGR